MEVLERKVYVGEEIADPPTSAARLPVSTVSQIRVRPDRRRSAGSLSSSDRDTLERWARSRSASYRLVLRSRIVLMVWNGSSRAATAKALGTTTRTVRLWCRRFSEGGAEVLRHDAPGRGRRSGLSADAVRAVIAAATVPPGARRPTVREIAAAVGVSPASVCRVWAANGLHPRAQAHRPTDAAAPARAPLAEGEAARCETGSASEPIAPVAGRLLSRH